MDEFNPLSHWRCGLRVLPGRRTPLMAGVTARKQVQWTLRLHPKGWRLVSACVSGCSGLMLGPTLR